MAHRRHRFGQLTTIVVVVFASTFLYWSWPAGGLTSLMDTIVVIWLGSIVVVATVIGALIGSDDGELEPAPRPLANPSRDQGIERF